ncbi:MAG TPA: hypothetical protein DDZ80_22540 [Cyanobacteria bacterium UBA8803]|nr:hypothetical protein [Cyanobacteria bacterium UBA9273]HBL61105.1 hypothetical protein [Cyanobacteria bacterium UBA8803]
MTNTHTPSHHHIPKSVIKTSREELDIPELQIHRQENKNTQSVPVDKLPEDLQGYAFIVGALFQAEDRPQEDGTLLYTGDGMIYRLGFEDGQATLKTRIAKTPCYYADLPTQLYLAEKAIEPKAQFAQENRIFSYFSGFRNGGQSRYSIILGGRNQLNTAFLQTRDYLLVTIDAGRPYIVDPDTLELIEPIGSTSQWKGIFPVIAKVFRNNIFDIYVNSAHPVADLSHSEERPDEIFTTNYSTGYNGKYKEPVNRILDSLSVKLKILFKDKKIGQEDFGRFTDLIRYQFGDKEAGIEPKMKSWRMMLPDGKPILVEQSLHQIALTEKYLILSDINFRMEFSQIFSPFIFGFLRLPLFRKKVFDCLGAWIYAVFLSQCKPLPFGTLYIVKREDLMQDPDATEVTAKKVIIPIEISHFAADYANPNNQITIHIGHSNGWDVTEGITRYDKPVPGKSLRHDLEGMMSGTTDLGCLGRYVIDGETGEIESTELLHDPESTWSLSVYTHRDLSRDCKQSSSRTIKNIYWMSWGFTWELIPQRIYEAYKADKNRVVAIEKLSDYEHEPVTLLRLDTETMEIVDRFHFPDRHFACSPQFIPSSQPCPEGKDESTHGYIVCIVLADDPVQPDKSRDEFWIFHADDFNNKPIYRLSAPSNEKPLNLALSLHSTWLRDLYQGQQYSEDERRQKREASIKLDYDYLLKEKSPTIQNLFHNIVYPHFINQTLEDKFEEILKSQTES